GGLRASHRQEKKYEITHGDQRQTSETRGSIAMTTREEPLTSLPIPILKVLAVSRAVD
uniref:Uncharacterized protein n=1 Tax=Magallana gigas TaxID=29159 RepID=A0A8W8JC57_MAGGI